MKNIIFFLLSLGCYSLLISAESQEPRVLFAHYKSGLFGGVASDIIVRSKAFLANQLVSTLIIAKDGARIAEQLRTEGLPFVEAVLPRSFTKNINTVANLVAPICKQLKINLMLCTSDSQMQLAKILKRKFGIKIVCIRHSEIRKDTNLSQFLGIDGFIGVNNNISSTCSTFFKKNKVKMPLITTIKPFLDDQKFLQFQTTEPRHAYFDRVHGVKIPIGAQVITSVGLFYGPKRQDILLRAAAIILAENKNVHFFFAGEGHLLDKAKKLANYLDISKNVHFLGFHKDIPALLYHSDIHVLSSTLESAGLATLEAGLMGKPALVSSETGAAEFIIDGVTGYLFQNGSHTSLASKLLFLLSNKNHCLNLGAAAKKHVLKHYSSQVTFEKTFSFLQKILSSSDTPEKAISRRGDK